MSYTSFKNQSEYNMYVSMLDEEELESLEYARILQNTIAETIGGDPYGGRGDVAVAEDGKQK